MTDDKAKKDRGPSLAKSIAASNKRIGRQVLVRFFTRIRVKE
jgi:hypothetical protein